MSHNAEMLSQSDEVTHLPSTREMSESVQSARTACHLKLGVLVVGSGAISTLHESSEGAPRPIWYEGANRQDQSTRK